MNRVGIFVDIGNQYYCVNKKWPGRKLDYKKYLEEASKGYSTRRVFAYGTQLDDSVDRFIGALKYLGYEPVFRQVENGAFFSWDAGMAVDMIRLRKKVDTIIIGSASRNLAPVIQYLKSHGIKVIVLACSINKELKEVADEWLEITESILDETSAAA